MPSLSLPEICLPISLRFSVFPLTTTSAPICFAFSSRCSTMSVAMLKKEKGRKKKKLYNPFASKSPSLLWCNFFLLVIKKTQYINNCGKNCTFVVCKKRRRNIYCVQKNVSKEKISVSKNVVWVMEKEIIMFYTLGSHLITRVKTLL